MDEADGAHEARGEEARAPVPAREKLGHAEAGDSADGVVPLAIGMGLRAAGELVADGGEVDGECVLCGEVRGKDACCVRVEGV